VNMAMKAEESPLLRIVTRKPSVKTLQRNIIMEKCYQVKITKGILKRKCGVICSVEISNSVIVICSYEILSGQ
jgi:hypothetical protein